MVTNWKNIIIRMPNWIGDAVMASPLIADLKAFFPNAHLTVMCQGKVGEIFEQDPQIDEIFSFHRPSGWIHRDASRNILAPLRHGHYDLGILTTNSFSSAWWFWRGHVKNRLGFSGNLRSPLLTLHAKRPNLETTHLVTVYKHLLVPLGIPISDTLPKLYLSQKETDEAKSSLRKYEINEGTTVIGMNPGAAFGTAKCWLPERFRALASKLTETSSVRVVFFGDPSQASLVKSICEPLSNHVINLAGKTTLREMMALLSLCDVVVTNDSGPMHIASAVGTPLVALFGSTNDVKTGPYNGGVVIHKHPSCSPCYERICPIDFRCMKEITVDEVYNEVMRLLEKQSLSHNS